MLYFAETRKSSKSHHFQAETDREAVQNAFVLFEDEDITLIYEVTVTADIRVIWRRSHHENDL